MMRSFYLAAVLGGALLAGQADNTARNKRDREDPSKTAQHQSERKADREVAAAIRKQIVDDKAFSTYAHNAKVVVRGMQVTLRGPVRTAEEKQKLEDIAKTHAGERKVVNELEVVPLK